MMIIGYADMYRLSRVVWLAKTVAAEWSSGPTTVAQRQLLVALEEIDALLPETEEV